MNDAMADVPITSWPEVFKALRRPAARRYAALVLTAGFTLYVACVEASLVVPALVHDFAVRPLLVAVFGHEPAPAAVEIAMGIGSGLLLMYRLLPWATRVLWFWSRHAWRRPAAGPGRDGDGPTLLALFAIRTTPAYLINVVTILSPYPDAPSWRHPRRRWRIMTAWAMRTGELMAEAGRLADAGLLRCTERGRRRGMWMYEVTDLGRDVALRSAEVLMNGRTEERA